MLLDLNGFWLSPVHCVVQVTVVKDSLVLVLFSVNMELVTTLLPPSEVTGPAGVAAPTLRFTTMPRTSLIL